MSAPFLRVPTSRWIGMAALVVLCAGLAAALVQWKRPTPDPREPRVSSPPAHSTEAETEKNRWVEEIPGVDAASLEPARRALFLRIANARACTCGCGYTLAACRVQDPSCDKSGPRVAALLDSIRDLAADAVPAGANAAGGR